MSLKTFVPDASVLLYDPDALFAFQENRVVVTSHVFEELTKKREYPGEVGYAARMTLRYFDELITGKEDVKLPNGGLLFVDTTPVSGSTDQYILDYLKKNPDFILVTKNPALRIRARQQGLRSEDYTKDRVSHLYDGYVELSVPSDAVDEFFRKGFLTPQTPLIENQMIQLTASANTKHTALGIYKEGRIQALDPLPHLPYQATNREQQMALALLFEPDICFVSLSGPPGTGKTFLATMAGYLQAKDKRYTSLLLARAIGELDEGHGFLGGDLLDKLEPWMGPFVDNLKMIMKGKNQNPMTSQEMYAYMKQTPLFEIAAITFMRGRTLYGQFAIFDEYQNLNPSQSRTLVSRIGKGSKMVATGDPSDNQIDNPLLSPHSNGLVFAIDRMKGDKYSAHITFPESKVERSPIAQSAAVRMK